jgi:hypothetical protein
MGKRKNYRDLKGCNLANMTQLTEVLDSALLDPHTWEELLDLCNTHRGHCLVRGAEGRPSEDFLSIARIKSHVNFRCKHDAARKKEQDGKVWLEY